MVDKKYMAFILINTKFCHMAKIGKWYHGLHCPNH